MTTNMTKPLSALRPAVAFAAAAFICVSPNAAPQPCGQSGDIDTLFKFSQLAERPEDHTETSLNCPAEGTPDIAVPNQSAETFPASTTAAVNEELRVREALGSPFAESSEDDNTRLYVVCPRRLGIDTLSIPLDIAVEMMVLRAESGADTVRLDVVTRVPADPQTERAAGEWTPVTGPQATITFPGTNREDRRQLLANFSHEPCLFPAAHLALHALCALPNTPSATDSSGTARTPETSEDTANGWLRTDENGRPTVVGHSLGGAVTQYIAITTPPEPLSTDSGSRNACSGVNAYTFGSTGLTTDTAGASPSIHGDLTSYASDCDFLVHCVPKFDQRVQPGRVLTLGSYNHWIDDIQAELCSCRRSAGTQVLHDHGTRSQPPQNLSLFGLARESNGYCTPPPPEAAEYQCISLFSN